MTTPAPLARVQARVRTRHGQRTVTLSCAHGRTVLSEPDEGLGADTTAAQILAARGEHERDSGCDCLAQLADALGLDR